MALAGCSTVHQPLEPGVFYKRDIGIEVNGRAYEGVVVVPYASKYDLILEPKGDLDMVLLRTCHREETVEKMQAKKFWRSSSTGKYLYNFEPIKGLETGRVCPLRIDVYEAAKERHSWAHVEFESPDYTIEYELACNGETKLVRGVGVCQAKKETVQRVKFLEPVQFAPVEPSGCSVPVWVDNAYEIEVYGGECLYQVRNRAGDMARLTTIGYGGVLIREPK